MIKGKSKPTISNRFIEAVCTRLADNKQVRRSLPIWGRMHIDRQLPFLCIYRQRKTSGKSLSDGLITGEASYLTIRENRLHNKQLSSLVKSIAGTLKNSFGSFLLVEVWVAQNVKKENGFSDYNGGFKIIIPRKNEISSTVETLERSLNNIKIRRQKANVGIEVASKIAPPGLAPLIPLAEARQLGFHVIGIEVDPVYMSKDSDQVFPVMYQKLKRGFSKALKNSFFEFTYNNTPYQPPHYHSLGRRSLVKAVWEVDKQLADICTGFDFLLQVTPVNNEAAWSAFKRKKLEVVPQFSYRPLSINPSLAKRKLFQIPIERIEDPTLAQLFREQQLELDRKFTMLIDRGKPSFLYGSMALYGGIENSLVKLSRELLEKLHPHSRDESVSHSIDANAFALRAEKELAYFRRTIPDLSSKVVVRDDISGLMVSKGNLLIGARAKIPEARVEALIAHEVGTHILTYLNGKSQRLQQLYIGLPGYDELQEGLAVLSEFIVGGLTGTRVRLLAARVIAAHQMIDGASFIDVFRELNANYGFERRTAFNICMRTYRGGGLTKDVVYLQGLVQLLEYLRFDGELEPLFLGKIAGNHIAIIQELQWRKVLHAAPLRPAYLDDPNTIDKLAALKNGLSIIDLIKKSKS